MKTGAGPRHLPHVLQAIEDLGDVKGSTTRRIMDQLEYSQYSKNDRPKNLTTEVRKALKFAIDNGLVKERSGRFAVSKFYGLSRKTDPSKSIFDCRRNKRKRRSRSKRGGGRRRRRRASISSPSDSEAVDDWKSDQDDFKSRSRSRSPGYEPKDEIITAKRGGRRRRRAKSGRRSRRGRRHDLLHPVDDTASPRDDRRCLAHHLQDCDNPGCQRRTPNDKHEDILGSYII